MRLSVLIPLLILLGLITACGVPEYIEKYEANIPEEESVNASLYNYELILENVREHFKAERYLAAVTNVMEYYRIFEQDDEYGWIDYYLAWSLIELEETSELETYYRSLSGSQKYILKLKPELSVDGTVTNLVYDGWHLEQILKNRWDYQLEKRIVSEYKCTELIRPVDKEGMKENLKLLVNMVKYYADADSIYECALNPYLFPRHLMPSSKAFKQYDLCLYTLSNIRGNRLPEKQVCLKEDFITVRNKYNYLRSRLVDRLEPWEEVTLCGMVSNTNDGSIWALVRYRDDREGFIHSKHIDEKGFYDADRVGIIDFRSASRDWAGGDYLSAARKASSLILSRADSNLHDRAVILLYKCHREIALRATSKRNIYYNYVREHSRYFHLEEYDVTLGCTDLLFRYLSRKNPDSEYLHLFI